MRKSCREEAGQKITKNYFQFLNQVSRHPTEHIELSAQKKYVEAVG